MLLTEYNEAAAMELFKEDGRREGVLSTLIRLVKGNKLSIEDAAAEANMSTKDFSEELYKKD